MRTERQSTLTMTWCMATECSPSRPRLLSSLPSSAHLPAFGCARVREPLGSLTTLYSLLYKVWLCESLSAHSLPLAHRGGPIVRSSFISRSSDSFAAISHPLQLTLQSKQDSRFQNSCHSSSLSAASFCASQSSCERRVTTTSLPADSIAPLWSALGGMSAGGAHTHRH